jgi:hypothetical protein
MKQDAAAAAKAYNALVRKQGWACHCDGSLSFDRPELHDLLATWHALRGSAPLPRRSDFTARLLKPHLASMTIYEKFCAAPARYRVRLMGTRFAQVYGDMTGKIIDEAVPPPRVPRFLATFDHVFQAGVPLRFITHADIIDKQFFVGEYFVAPLSDDAGKPTMLLSRVHFSAESSWPTYLDAALKRLAAPALV